LYLRNRHIGKENTAKSTLIKYHFGINCTTLRQIINKLRINGHPVCENTSGYFYAKNPNEINSTLHRLLKKAKESNDAVQGLVLSHQVFYDGMGG